MADEIRQFVVGPIETNCYAYISEGQCLVVDPGASGAWIAEQLADVEVSLIVATHRHHDHVCGVAALKEKCAAPWAISSADATGAVRALEISSHSFNAEACELANPPEPDRLLSEGDVLELGSARFEVIEAPGHTEGGIVLLGGGTATGVAFVGDTLFAGGCGRCDLPGGNWAAMKRTLAMLCRRIPGETSVLTGHGAATTMERELKTNPYLDPGAWRPSAS